MKTITSRAAVWIFAVWTALGSAAAEPDAVKGGTEASLSGAALEEALGLAVRGISLFQGEEGFELWRLKASWAHIAQEDGVIEVDTPVVRYTLGDPALEDYMDVTSRKGRITDNQRRLALWGDVVVRRGTQTVAGGRLDYDAATRTMVFPEGAGLDGPTASGEASRFSWNLETNVMTGEGGVSVLLKARPETSEPHDAFEGESDRNSVSTGEDVKAVIDETRQHAVQAADPADRPGE